MALFSESELQATAQALGATEQGLTNSEIDELFQLCRIPDDFGPATKWRRIYVSLWNKQVRDGQRKASLAFIRKAMKPERYLRDPDRFTVMQSSLNKALSFAGLEVDDRGQLRKSAPVHNLPEAEQRAKELRSDLELRGVHPDVLSFCKAELVADNYFHAVLEAVKSIFDKLRRLTGLSDDGAPLVDSALCGASPLLSINGLATDSERSEQAGRICEPDQGDVRHVPQPNRT